MREFPRIGFTIFLGRLIRRYCLLRLRISFAFLVCRKREANAVTVTEWRTTEIVFARKFGNIWSLIKNGLIKIIHFLMRLRPKQSIEMPKQSIEICLLNTLHLFHWYTQVPRKLSVNNQWPAVDFNQSLLRWKADGRFLSSDWHLRYEFSDLHGQKRLSIICRHASITIDSGDFIRR